MNPEDEKAMVERWRTAAVAAARAAWEEGGLAGLCVEGRFELVLDRLARMPEPRVPRQPSA
jgi:hypothetical protein